MAITWLYLLITLSRVGFKEFGDGGLGTYTLDINGCYKNRSGALGQEETLPRTRSVINCTPLLTRPERVWFPEPLATTVVSLKLLVSNFQNVIDKISVIQLLSCVRLCNPMDYSTPGFHVIHCLPEFSQTHVHWVDEAIHPSLGFMKYLLGLERKYGIYWYFVCSTCFKLSITS